MTSLETLLLALDDAKENEVTLLLHAISDWHEEQGDKISQSWRKVANCTRRPLYTENEAIGPCWVWRHGGLFLPIKSFLLPSGDITHRGTTFETEATRKSWIVGNSWFVVIQALTKIERTQYIPLKEDGEVHGTSYLKFPTRSEALSVLVKTLHESTHDNN